MTAPHTIPFTAAGGTFQASIRAIEVVGGHAWCAEADCTIRVRSIPCGKEIRLIPRRHRSLCNGILGYKDKVWTAFTDGCVRVFTPSGGLVAELCRHEGSVQCIYSACDKIFTGGTDWSIIQWDPNLLAFERRFHGHTNNVRCLMGGPVRFLFSGSDDGTVRMWTLEDPHTSFLATLKGSTKAVLCLAYDRQHNHLWAAGEDAVIRVWDAATLRVEAFLDKHRAPVTLLSLENDHICSSDREGKLYVWSCGTKGILYSLESSITATFLHAIRRVEVSLLWKFWACGKDGTVTCWNTEIPGRSGDLGGQATSLEECGAENRLETEILRDRLQKAEDLLQVAKKELETAEAEREATLDDRRNLSMDCIALHRQLELSTLNDAEHLRRDLERWERVLDIAERLTNVQETKQQEDDQSLVEEKVEVDDEEDAARNDRERIVLEGEWDVAKKEENMKMSPRPFLAKFERERHESLEEWGVTRPMKALKENAAGSMKESIKLMEEKVKKAQEDVYRNLQGWAERAMRSQEEATTLRQRVAELESDLRTMAKGHEEAMAKARDKNQSLISKMQKLQEELEATGPRQALAKQRIFELEAKILSIESCGFSALRAANKRIQDLEAKENDHVKFLLANEEELRTQVRFLMRAVEDGKVLQLGLHRQIAGLQEQLCGASIMREEHEYLLADNTALAAAHAELETQLEEIQNRPQADPEQFRLLQKTLKQRRIAQDDAAVLLEEQARVLALKEEEISVLRGFPTNRYMIGNLELQVQRLRHQLTAAENDILRLQRLHTEQREKITLLEGQRGAESTYIDFLATLLQAKDDAMEALERQSLMKDALLESLERRNGALRMVVSCDEKRPQQALPVERTLSEKDTFIDEDACAMILILDSKVRSLKALVRHLQSKGSEIPKDAPSLAGVHKVIAMKNEQIEQQQKEIREASARELSREALLGVLRRKLAATRGSREVSKLESQLTAATLENEAKSLTIQQLHKALHFLETHQEHNSRTLVLLQRALDGGRDADFSKRLEDHIAALIKDFGWMCNELCETTQHVEGQMSLIADLTAALHMSSQSLADTESELRSGHSLEVAHTEERLAMGVQELESRCEILWEHIQKLVADNIQNRMLLLGMEKYSRIDQDKAVKNLQKRVIQLSDSNKRLCDELESLRFRESEDRQGMVASIGDLYQKIRRLQRFVETLVISNHNQNSNDLLYTSLKDVESLAHAVIATYFTEKEKEELGSVASDYRSSSPMPVHVSFQEEFGLNKNNKPEKRSKRSK